MLKFLGVSAAMLQSGTGKKEKAPVSAVVNNIDQLKSELSGTKYESYI
ncbi:Sulfotransferase [Pseudomonas syringae pv. maculicola]|nr:Sulfotransferase [Pseudomonas syringae pv. maculicola]